MYDSNKARAAQAEYCKRTNAPHFAPKDGRCWRCGKDIYAPIEVKYGDKTYTHGITVEEAESRLVTGCPHCNRSYCD